MKKVNITAICLYFALTSVIIVGCDTDRYRREKLSDKNNIMIDQDGNKWLIKHTYGDNYRIDYLTDSVGWNAH